MIHFFKKYHKWLSIILIIFILIFSISGIILNHRHLLAGFDVSRNWMPEEYRYHHWDNAAVRGTFKLNEDSILIYGNIGIWLTDKRAIHFSDFNTGLPEGIDNRKICKIYKTKQGILLAGTLFGLYRYDKLKRKWNYIEVPLDDEHIVDFSEKKDTLLILSRSYLLKTTDIAHFSVKTLPIPEDYDNKVSLFKTLWVIHSGELYGHIGVLLVDLIGLIFIFLSITGLIYFINPYLIRKNKKKDKSVAHLSKTSRWSLKWHNKIGWITVLFLIITATTGMFLRPPLLIAIVNSRVGKIPHTTLSTPNPWNDKLRRMIYDETHNRYIISTLDGVYFSDDDFSSSLKRFKHQPPISVMGPNVFQMKNDSIFLVGSFLGLFEWNPKALNTYDYIDKKLYHEPTSIGNPIGNHLITGYSNDFQNGEVFFDYGAGAYYVANRKPFVPMPEILEQQPISLWNFALEFHTGRIFLSLIGNFYILYIPLLGLSVLFILISGFIVWYTRHRKKKPIEQ